MEELEGALDAAEALILGALAGEAGSAARERYAGVLNALRARGGGDTLRVTFRSPVQSGDRSFDAVDLRAPTWGEMKGALKNGSIEASTWLASMLGGVPIPVLNKLDARDGAEIDRFFARFS